MRATQQKFHSNNAAGKLNKNFNDQDRYTINKGSYKNSFSRIIAVCIYIKSKQNSISQKAKRSDRSDQSPCIKKIIKEFYKSIGRKFKKIDDDKAQYRSDQPKN